MKVQGTYSSVVRGVSQQAPADRLEGQHGEVVNMISDPVRGLVRRNGMVLESFDTSELGAATDTDVANATEDSGAFRVYTYRSDGTDYDVLYRSRGITGANSPAHLPGILAYDRTYDDEHVLPTVTGGWDADLQTYMQGGFAAVGNLGAYILAAPVGVKATQVVTERWANTGNLRLAAIWVRGGSYSRKYTINVTRAFDNATFSVEYTTPSSQYDGILDFTGITVDPSDPAYQVQVNNIQAAYDTAVNQHIAMAAAAINPEAIAQKLLDELIDLGWMEWNRVESTLLSFGVSELEVLDGAGGEYMRATLNEETAITDLPTIAHYDKVVKIAPAGADPFYMVARPATDAPGSATAGRVIWREGPGEIQTPGFTFAIGTITNGKLYMASTPTDLQTLLDTDSLGLTVPTLLPSVAGDTTTSPPPNFVGKEITMIGTFQDRLIFGAGGTVSMSQRGDYFNFYRTTVVTLPDSDPLEVSVIGADNDTIRKVTLHEMNLFVHGDKRHYMIPGRAAITPQSASMGVMWEVNNSAAAQPISNGANLFILKEELQVGASRLLQVQPGLYQDIPQLQDVSQQLRDYINGFPAEVVAFLNPGTVFVRTEFVRKSRYGFPRSRKQGIYMYQYTDQGDQRVVDSWSAWEWSEYLGRPVGIAAAGFGDTLRIYTLVHGVYQTGGRVRALQVLRAGIRPDPSGLPYLDAVTNGSLAETVGMYTPIALDRVDGLASHVFTSPGAEFSFEEPLVGHDPNVVLPDGPNWTVGDTNPTVVDPIRWRGILGHLSDFDTEYGPLTEERAAAVFTGLKFHSYVELTNPFMRDQDGKADTLGQLNLTRLHVITTRTAGFTASWKDYDGQVFTNQLIGTYEQINYAHNVFVGRDTRHVQIRLAASGWLPLTINGISWQGNWFGGKQVKA